MTTEYETDPYDTAQADAPRVPEQRGAADRPGLDVGNAAKVADWLRENLGRGPLSGIFRRGGSLVYASAIGDAGYIPPADGNDDGQVQVRPATARTIRARVQYGWAPYRMVKDKEAESGYGRQPATVPVDAADIAASASDMLPHVRDLRGVVHAPLVRRDGSILSAPGYDADTRLLYLPTPGLTVPDVPERPTRAQVNTARDLLMHMVSGFPFVTDHDRAAYLGLLLTPLLRDLVPPPYKMFCINAHQAGSGKTFLMRAALSIHGGVFRSEMPDDEPELRKQVTTILDTTTGPVVGIDNVSGLLRSSTLAGLLTSAVWEDRRLGGNQLATCANDRVWVLTGNNIALGGDLIRRTVWVSIDPGMPDPQLRTGFAIADFEAWVTQHRGELLHALLTLIRAWIAAGKPGEQVSSDGYAAWLRAIGGILAVAGVPGRFDAPEARQQAEGTDDQDWADFLTAARESFGSGEWTVKALLARVDTSDTTPLAGGSRSIPAEALPGDLAEQAMRIGVATMSKSLGRWLLNRQGRWAGGMTVRAGQKAKAGVRWRVLLPGER